MVYALFMKGFTMTIDELVQSFCNIKTQSETEVRTKFANPLCELLEYPVANRAEEFPVHGFEGGKKIHPKPADILLFSSNDFATKKSDKIDDKKWVRNNSLLLIEVKKSGKSIDAEGQAVYYAAWTRIPLFIITNGEQIRFYRINANFSDELIIECTIQDIPMSWGIIYENFSFPKALKLKETAAQRNETVEFDMYRDYCSNMIVNLNATLNRMLGRQVSKSSTSYFDTKPCTDTDEQIDYKDIFSQNDSVVILSEPGGGKSYLLSMIARDALFNMSTSNKIPVIVDCRYFNITFKDIETAILKAVAPFCPAITNEIVKRNIIDGKYMLLFDALDEIKRDKEILIGMIKDIIISRKNKIAVSERQENYHDEFSAFASKYHILPLNETDIVQYISQKIKHSLNYYALNEQCRLLLTRPLFLFIFVETVTSQTQDEYSMPKNTTLLFDNFFRHSLRQKHVPKTEITLIEQILSYYAEWLMENQESDAKLIEYIHEKVGVNQTEKYMELMIKSGIMIQGIDGLRFFHNSFLEYFFAKRIVQYDECALIDFLGQHQNDDRYHEIICFIVGIISDKNKQNVVLDYLQEHNLALFIKALNSRYKFDRLQTDTEYNYAEAYFTQIQNTYLKLIDTYFYKIKTFFSPFYPSSNEENQKLKLIGDINTSTYFLNLKLVCVDKGDTDISLMSKNDVFYGYGLTASSLLDSAREIAVRMIKAQFLKFINAKTIVNLNCHILMVECIEDAVDQLRKKRLLPPEFADISLSNNTNQVLEFLFAYRDNSTICFTDIHRQTIVFGVPSQKITFELLYNYCSELINSGKEIAQFVLPKRDISDPKPRDNRFPYDYDFFSKEQLVKRIQKIIELSERGYEELILTHFPALFNKLVKSKGHYFQYVKIHCSGIEGGISKTIIATQTKENEIFVALDDSTSNWMDIGWQLSHDLKDVLTKIGATEKDVMYWSSEPFSYYLLENALHNFIYKRLEADFEKIFEGKH